MKTKLTELLGIKYPVIQGGMAWTSDAVLAAAVSNAGGAGIIGSGGRTVEWTRDEVRKAKSLTDKPFGVNVMLMAPNIAEIIAMLCEEKVAFVTLGAGNPVPHIPAFHAAGIKVIPVVPNVKLAKRIEAAGADAMVIEGMEAGGHIGKQTTMALMENVTYSPKGRIYENSFMQYKVPCREDIGHIYVDFASSYEESGPFGAKSVGELVINTPAPAIADAIYQATGKRFMTLPITPEKVAMGVDEE